MGSVTPLYQRLPRGPHRLGATEVARNQRIRMYGAMVEVVDAVGYQRTSVKKVISLAGVSRRAFYEQFSNKEECFLAAFDLIVARWVKRVNEAYLSADGDLEDRLRVALTESGEEINANWKGAGLVMLQAQTAGSTALLHVRQAAVTFERMLSSSFAHAPAASPLPIPVVRGIVGGLHEVVASRLREGRASEVPDLTDELLGWTLLFDTPAAERMSATLGRRMTARLAEVSPIPAARGRVPHAEGERYLMGAHPSEDPRLLAAIGDPASFGLEIADAGESSGARRARLLASVLRLAVREDYQDLSAPQISQAADVPIEAFVELFADREACFLAALDVLCENLFRVVSDTGPAACDWPSSVRLAIARLMSDLADHPLCARTIAAEAFTAGPAAIDRVVTLFHRIAAMFANADGAPEPTHTPLAVEGVAGAIFHTVRCQVVSGQTHLLPVLSDHLSFVVLAPFLGADAAAEILADEDLAGV